MSDSFSYLLDTFMKYDTIAENKWVAALWQARGGYKYGIVE